VIGGTGIVGLFFAAALVASAQAVDQTQPPPVLSLPPQQSAPARLPPHAVGCIRKNADPRIWLDIEAVAPDPAKMAATLQSKRSFFIDLVNKCGFERTYQGGQQLGGLISSIGLKDWSEGRLGNEYFISSARLQSVSSEISREDLKIISTIQHNPHVSDIEVGTLRSAMRQMLAKLGLSGERATLLVGTYLISEAMLSPFD
jgi:hypothetical protein